MPVPEELPGAADVVVVGSGAAGLTAALAAAVAGAQTVVLEAADVFGGTTGVSGGQVWVPANPRMADLGVADSLDDARRYCLAHAPGRDPALIDAFLAAAPRMARFVEEHSPIEWRPMAFPDSYAEGPGGRPAGRNLEVSPLATDELTPWADFVTAPPYPPVLTNDEVAEHQLTAGGAPPMELIGPRMQAGEVTLGVGLVIGLLQGCRQVGVRLVRGARVRELVRAPAADAGSAGSAGPVAAVLVEQAGELRRVAARRGVVLATGGFEHDAELVGALQGVRTVPASPPQARGDGIRLAGAVGAQLARLDESWHWPVLDGHGDTWDDPAATPRAQLAISERALPHVIWVNRAGVRFVDEASHNCALAFGEIDPATAQPRNLPAFAVGDARFRSRYAVAGVPAGKPAPDWLAEADTLPELAAAIGVDADGLLATVRRFNEHVRAGRDADFGRGDSAYDRYLGDRSAEHPNLGGIEEPPFFAVPVRPGTVGTKGGARTDARAAVLDWSDRPIPGLYAAGNATAAVIGPGTLSAGMTIGLAATWGWLAGTSAAGAAPS
jgi:succinate dehydrogenase/fumarate reductase flavoprotein subunit